MKKFLYIALVLTMVLALAVPALAAAPSGFVDGTVVTIDKKGYDSFDGKEITANNSSTAFDGFSFVADNKTLNAWYINVTDDISGTLEVAYKISSGYYIVTFAIDGAGKYFIADSRGSNGANMVKIGAFVENKIVTDTMKISAEWYWIFDDPNQTLWRGLYADVYENGPFDFVAQLTNGYGDLEPAVFVKRKMGQSL